MTNKPLSDGKVAGTGTLVLNAGCFGGALISTDGTNAAVVVVTDNGKKIFDVSTKTPLFAAGPIFSTGKSLEYSVTGTGASAQFYEWIA